MAADEERKLKEACGAAKKLKEEGVKEDENGETEKLLEKKLLRGV